MNAESLQINIGFIGDFLYPIIANQHPSGISGSRVAGIEFIRALLEHGSCQCTFFVSPKYDRVLRQSAGQWPRVSIFNLLEMKSQITDVSLIHDLMLHRIKAINNIRAAYGKKNIPITAVHHALSHHLILNACHEIACGKCLKEYDAIVCPTQHGKTILRNFFSKVGVHTLPGSYYKIPWGVSESLFKPRNKPELRNRYHLPLERNILLYVGRLSYYDKSDLLPLLFGFKRLLQKDGTSTGPLLLIIGSEKGEAVYSPILRKYVQAMRLQDSVKIIENVEPDVLPLYYSLSDIFISPCDSLTETFGLTLIEAMASGLPAVVSDWNGYKNIVEHGNQGFKVKTIWGRVDTEFQNLLFEIYDPVGQLYAAQTTAIDMHELFSYVEILLNNDELRNKMSENARATAIQLYSWKKVIAQYEAMWAELVQKAAGSNQQRSPYLTMDILSDFESYPAQILDGEQKIVLTEDGQLLIQGSYDLGYYMETSFLIQSETAVNICCECTTSISLNELNERTQIDLHDLHQHVVWLIKYGFLRLA